MGILSKLKIITIITNQAVEFVTRAFSQKWLILIMLASMQFLSPATARVLTSLNFEHLSAQNGFSQSNVIQTIEDKYGFIWIVSSDGLSKYDGFQNRLFSADGSVPGSIPSNSVSGIVIDDQRNLWIATDQGLSKYHYETDSFSTITTENSIIKANEISAIASASGKEIYFTVQNSLYRLNAESEKVTQVISQSPFPTSIMYIKDENSRIWMSSAYSGIYIFDKISGQLFDLTLENPWNFTLPNVKINKIEVVGNKYWIATNKGLITLDSSTNKQNNLSQALNPELPSNVINALNFDGESLWIGTNRGLAIADKDSNIQTVINHNNAFSSGLRDSNISNIFISRMGTAWIGTASAGLHNYHPASSPLKLYKPVEGDSKSLSGRQIIGFANDIKQDIWVATRLDGLNKFNQKQGYYIQIPLNITAMVNDIKIDASNKVWLATSEGIYSYRIEGDSVAFENQIHATKSFEAIEIFNNRLWIWHQDKGLSNIDPKTYEETFVSLPSDISVAMPVFTDDRSKVWLQTNVGVLISDRGSNQFSRPSGLEEFGQLNIIQVYSHQDAYWVITENKGIFKLDKVSLTLLKQFSGLNDNATSDIRSAIGLENSIWYGSRQGIYTLDFDSSNIVKRRSKSALNFNELGRGAIIATADGNLLIGGSIGIHYLKTKQQNVNKYDKPVEPQFISFSAPNKSLEQETPQLPAFMMHRFDMAHSESRINIEFGVINSINSNATEYRYILEGLDKDWTYTTTNRLASYSYLSFGDYIFKVQARINGGEWSQQNELIIAVEKPFWLNTRALIFYAFFIIFLVIYQANKMKSRKNRDQTLTEDVERLTLTLSSSGDELWDWDIFSGQIYRANTWNTIDFPQDSMRSHTTYENNVHENDVERLKQSLDDHLDGKTQFFELAYRVKTFAGDWVWVLDRGKVVKRDAHNKAQRMTGTLKNINHLKQAEEQLNLFKSSFENITEGVFIADQEFKFMSVNSAYCNFTGDTVEKALASKLSFSQYPEAFTEEVKKTLRHKGSWSGEVDAVRTNGEKYQIEMTIDAIRNEDNHISHYVGVFSDISSRKKTEKELLKLANTDPLTNLPNRSFFQASHENLVRRETPHALICLDMDNFKRINDSLGHQTGDLLIKQIARRLQKITTSSSTTYRLGGDEFSMLVEATATVHRISHIAQDILDTLSRPFYIAKQEFVLGVSIGIATYPEDGTSHQELLKNADTAMYFAKNNGGSNYQFFSGEMNKNAVRQLQIENLIRFGIKEDLFSVFYQPKVDIASGRMVSMEALVRFEHPQKGIVSPGQFIPLAEQTGQILEIGEQVLRKACMDTKRWVDAGLFTGRVAVNISAKQFELPDLDDRIERILKQVGLSPLHLECEITEGTLMENPEQALKMMQRLRERGIHLALDDFGTGYSSLAYLKKFPIHTLKIDKAFIDDIATSSVDKHMTESIIKIAHNLGLKVVAEGVEHENQLEILKRYDCEMLQGYLFSKPVSAAKFEQLLVEGRNMKHMLESRKPSPIRPAVRIAKS
ncbi:sensory box protein [Glaciecola sp. 33A]|nr:sensory box protein [Glaciecola sp. 33A]